MPHPPPHPSAAPDRTETVNGKLVHDIILDTGASKTIIRKELVPKGKMLDRCVEIKCAHGDETTYPFADVKVCIDGKEYYIKAAVSDRLPVSVLLGRDVPQLVNIGDDATEAARMVRKGGARDAMAITTRAQAKEEEKQELVLRRKEIEDGAVSTSLEMLEATRLTSPIYYLGSQAS